MQVATIIFLVNKGKKLQ